MGTTKKLCIGFDRIDIRPLSSAAEHRTCNAGVEVSESSVGSKGEDMQKFYDMLFGRWKIRRAKKKALKFIKSLPRDEYGRWIFPEDK